MLKTSGHETIQALLGSGLITPEQSAEAHRVAEERGQSPQVLLDTGVVDRTDVVRTAAASAASTTSSSATTR